MVLGNGVCVYGEGEGFHQADALDARLPPPASRHAQPGNRSHDLSVARPTLSPVELTGDPYGEEEGNRGVLTIAAPVASTPLASTDWPHIQRLEMPQPLVPSWSRYPVW